MPIPSSKSDQLEVHHDIYQVTWHLCKTLFCGTLSKLLISASRLPSSVFFFIILPLLSILLCDKCKMPQEHVHRYRKVGKWESVWEWTGSNSRPVNPNAKMLAAGTPSCADGSNIHTFNMDTFVHTQCKLQRLGVQTRAFQILCSRENDMFWPV